MGPPGRTTSGSPSPRTWWARRVPSDAVKVGMAPILAVARTGRNGVPRDVRQKVRAEVLPARTRPALLIPSTSTE
ncbi:hypothetical protein GCM10010377_33490 [Streptomyces viridiviolaceus]|nr:hypothetical protein GCM10010377_33490 [Streptomyces viridiviolaceus]